MRLLLAGLVLAAAAAMAGGARAQSFPCRYAHFADERAICRDPALGRLDDRLAAEYDRVASRLSRHEQHRLRAEEDRWVVSRRRCGDDAACIAKSYRRRMAELAERTLAERTPATAAAPPPRRAAPPRQAPVAASNADSVEPEVGSGNGGSANPTAVPPARSATGWINPAPER